MYRASPTAYTLARLFWTGGPASLGMHFSKMHFSKICTAALHAEADALREPGLPEVRVADPDLPDPAAPGLGRRARAERALLGAGAVPGLQ